jgi:hypothetical protein
LHICSLAYSVWAYFVYLAKCTILKGHGCHAKGMINTTKDLNGRLKIHERLKERELASKKRMRLKIHERVNFVHLGYSLVI